MQRDVDQQEVGPREEAEQAPVLYVSLLVGTWLHRRLNGQRNKCLVSLH